MAFRVFLSYSLDPGEVALAWRLQTLATAHGIEMYVPNYAGPAQPGSPSIQNAIDRADCILAIITTATSSSVQNELNYALGKGKLLIPIVRTELAHNAFLSQFPRVFIFSPWDNPGKIETQIVEFLKEKRVAKDQQQTIGALAALGLGLLLLVALNKE